MSRRLLRAATAAVALALLSVLPVVAHSGGEASGISVEPEQITAGDTVVLAGNGLEPNSERQINLVGPDVVVPFPTVTTDADGMFAVTLTIPEHLPAGTYTFQAIGDEVLTTECTIAAAAGMPATRLGDTTMALVMPRSRSSIEIGIIGTLVGMSIALGFLLVARAERFGRPAGP